MNTPEYPHVPPVPLLTEELLMKHSLDVADGICPPEEAKIICLTDPDHMANTQFLGRLIQEVRGPDDHILIEGYELEHAATYGVEGMDNVASWEDPAVYALALLVAGRHLKVTERLEAMRENVQRASWLKRLAGRMISAVSGRQTELKRWEAVDQRLDATSHQCVRAMRDEAIQSHLTAAANRPGRTFIIAGAEHFRSNTFLLNMVIRRFPLIVLEPMSEVLEDESAAEAAYSSDIADTDKPH